MSNTSKGLTLIELAIAMVLFGIISVAITSLTSEAVDQAQDRMDISHQQVIVSNLFDAMREDARNAVSACVSQDGAGCTMTNGVHSQDGLLSPQTGNTLDIIVHGPSYWNGTQQVVHSDNIIVRYQVYDNNGRTEIRRTSSAAGAAGPIDITDPTARIFNQPVGGLPEQNFSADFTAWKGQSVPLFSGGSSSWVTAVGIRNANLTSEGKGNKYDREFGNHQTTIPDTDFLVSQGLKFL